MCCRFRRRRCAGAAAGDRARAPASACALIRARNSGTRAASMVRPAACLWPPKRRKRSAQRSSASSMSKAGMLRQEPCATSPSTERTIAGLWYCVDQLRRGDADHAAVPAFAADDEHVVRADRRVGFDRLLRLRDEVRFLGLALAGSLRSAAAPSPRASSIAASSVASSRRVAMSGVLMRPAALTRGARMKPTW